MCVRKVVCVSAGHCLHGSSGLRELAEMGFEFLLLEETKCWEPINWRAIN